VGLVGGDEGGRAAAAWARSMILAGPAVPRMPSAAILELAHAHAQRLGPRHREVGAILQTLCDVALTARRWPLLARYAATAREFGTSERGVARYVALATLHLEGQEAYERVLQQIELPNDRAFTELNVVLWLQRFARGPAADVRTLVDRVSREHPHDYVLQLLVARALIQLGERTRARETLEQLRATGKPPSPEAQAELESIEARLDAPNDDPEEGDAQPPR